MLQIKEGSGIPYLIVAYFPEVAASRCEIKLKSSSLERSRCHDASSSISVIVTGSIGLGFESIVLPFFVFIV